MYRLENIEFLYAYLAIPVFILLFVLYRLWRKKALRLMADQELTSRLMPMVSSGKPILKFILFLLAFIFLIAGIVNPQVGTKMEEMKREGSDIVICLDVSNSMMAQDFSPNRLQKAKMAIEKLIDRLQNDRLGIIVFAGEAYVQLPITTDYAAAKLFLESVDTDAVPVQGTRISAAIDLAMKSFEGSEGSPVTAGKNKTIIVITDGESHEDDAISSARAAAEKGVIVNTIGIGSTEGVPFPVYRNKIASGYRKDKAGNTVITQLNENILREVASAGNGVYVRASRSEVGLNALMERVNKLEKKAFDAKLITDYEDRFQIFIAIALFFLIIESLTTERKSLWWVKLFSKNK